MDPRASGPTRARGIAPGPRLGVKAGIPSVLPRLGIGNPEARDARFYPEPRARAIPSGPRRVAVGPRPRLGGPLCSSATVVYRGTRVPYYIIYAHGHAVLSKTPARSNRCPTDAQQVSPRDFLSSPCVELTTKDLCRILVGVRSSITSDNPTPSNKRPL